MDDRVPLPHRHLQLGLRLLDKRPLFGAGNLRLRKTHGVSLLSNCLPSGGGQPPPQLLHLKQTGSKLQPGREASVWDGSTAETVAFQATVFVPAATHPRPATHRSLARDRGVCSPRSRSKHSSISTTFHRYSHLLPGMDEALAEETDRV
jgi:hypothetical protein